MLVELQNIKKTYDTRIILENLCLQVEHKQKIAITGPSGSGKTTLLNLIGAIDKPDEGKIFFNNQLISDLNIDKLATFRNTEIGFIFQMHHLLPQCTVFENVMIPTLANPSKEKYKKAETIANQLIERVGLEKQKHQRPTELSGGECQRTAFIRALINQPKLILADEPTGSLDQFTADILINLLLELNEENNMTLIVVTHSQSIANKMDKIYHIENYKLK